MELVEPIKEPQIVDNKSGEISNDSEVNECNVNSSHELDGEQKQSVLSGGDDAGIAEKLLDGNDDESVVQQEEIGDVEDDDGDPIPSGTGSVSKDCSASELLGWSEILPKWHNKLNQRPKGLEALVRNGIPEPLRGEVWQLLSGAQQDNELMNNYRIFLTKSAPSEQIILRDVHRTYPAHENFRTGGSSSLLDSLFKVCKAYAVYDAEVGYFQGLSFLVAALLLHMPEEQAFCVFVRIMQHYGLRDLFRNNFDELYLKFYQLEHLLAEHMPDLHQHFTKIGIEPFTYASQWFLTVFTAKFPLNAVFYIMDIFLLDGMNTIFQIALALLSSSRQELIALDFEGVLKYFRVQMPKRYKNQENVQQLISASSGISLKKLKKHAKNYELAKQKEKLMENPVTRLQRENAKLTENNLRLEQENDDLARDLVASKIQLRAQLDELEDKIENLNRSLQESNQDCQAHLSTISDMEDEKMRLEVEVNQLKEVCRRELSRAESELARDSNIIADYKKICSQLGKRLDHNMNSINVFIETISDSLRDNESCKENLCLSAFRSKSNDLLEELKQQEDKSFDEPQGDRKPESSSPKRRQSAESAEQGSPRPVGAYIKSTIAKTTSNEVKTQKLIQHIDELEVELARTKLALVEAECKCQQLTHDLSVGVSIKTSASSNQPLNSLTGGLDFVKAAVSNRRSPLVASNTFSKINNLISEKISNISGPTNTNTTTAITPIAPLSSGISNVNATSLTTASMNSNNNNSSKIVDQHRNQC